MCQVLYRLPIFKDGIPIYGFGGMLFFAFIFCTWLASWRAKKEGVPPQLLQDLAIWIFIGGIVGARIVYMIQYQQPIQQFFFIWQGGLVFYGSVIGGVIVAPRASELIFPLALAVEHRLTVDQVARAFTVYPSLSGSISDAARAMHIVL